MQERNLVALPLQLGKQAAGQMSMLRVLRHFEFDSALMRSAVLAVNCEDPDTGMFFVRGAPSVVEQLVRGGQVPTDYRQASMFFFSFFWVGKLFITSVKHICSERITRAMLEGKHVLDLHEVVLHLLTLRVRQL